MLGISRKTGDASCNLGRHSLWKKRFVVGNRRGNRKTIAVSWEAREYQTEIIEENTGAANILHFMNKEGKDRNS